MTKQQAQFINGIEKSTLEYKTEYVEYLNACYFEGVAPQGYISFFVELEESIERDLAEFETAIKSI